MNEFTAEELDRILERFDQTEPALQRQIVASVMADNALAKAFLGVFLDQIDGDPAASQFFDSAFVDRVKTYLS